MERMQKSVFWAVIVAETSHLFCCVFPTIFSILGFLAGVGLMTAMPAGLVHIHDLLHRWEIPIILFSAVMIAFGWGVDFMGRRLDCHDTGCVHEPCGTRKRKAHKVLIFATLLFAFNIVVYIAFHRDGIGIMPPFDEPAPIHTHL